MIALRTPGRATPSSPRSRCSRTLLSSRRFDLYGLVPRQAVGAISPLDPLPQAALAYAVLSFTRR